MNALEVLTTLSKAGYTKSEINALINLQPAPQVPQPPQSVPYGYAAPQVPQPQYLPYGYATPQPPQPAPVQPMHVDTAADMTATLQRLTAALSGVDVPPAVNLDQQIADHFTSLMIGSTQQATQPVNSGGGMNG